MTSKSGILSLACVLTALFQPLTSLAQSAWTSEAPMIKPRSETSAVMYQDDLFVFNGFGPAIDIEPSVEKYNFSSGIWSLVSTSSVANATAVTHNGIVRVGSKVWLIGGRIGDHPGAVSSKVWIYDLDNNIWTDGPDLPIASAGGGAALVDNNIHWFGGLDPLARCDVSNHFVLNLDNVSGGWQDISDVAAMPIPRNHFSTVVVNGKIIAIGGQFGHDSCPGFFSQDTDVVHQFDPQTNTWTQLADLPGVQSHAEPSTFVYQGLVYMVGGQTSGDDVYAYDVQSDTWSFVISLPERLLAPVSRIHDGRLYVAGGGAPSTSRPVTNVWSTELFPPSGGSTGSNTGSMIVVEAEDYDAISDTSSHQWITTALAGSSNSAAMVTTPDSGSLKSTASGSPMMSYQVSFESSGTHYLWVRGFGDDSSGEGRSDSVHVGLNGVLQPTSDKIDGFPDSWSWTNSTRDGPVATLHVPSAGVHTVNIWMREDGLVVDKFVMTRDSTFIPVGYGPSGGTTTIANSGPTVDAGSDQSIVLGQSVTLSGTVSDDGLPANTVSMSWTQVSGAGSASLSTPDQQSSTVSFQTDGIYVFELSASDGALSDQDTVVISVQLPSVSSGDDTIVVEAEDYDSISASGLHQWTNSTLGGSSNSGAMVTMPNIGTLRSGSNSSPMMGYQVNFSSAGIHYLWIRGWGDELNGEGKNDSLHAGLNGTLQSVSDKIDGFPAAWTWSNSTRDGAVARLNVPSAGMHTLNIWMREDGLAVDKYIITPDANYTPSGQGPTGGGTEVINSMPMVDAGVDQSITVGDGLVISGNVSDDGLPGGGVSVSWSQISGSGTVVFSSPNQLTTSVNIATAGVYVFALDAFDGALGSQDLVTITVAPQQTVSSGDGLIIVEAEDYTTLSASGVHQWDNSSLGGSSQGGAMVTTPNSGTLRSTASGSPMMSYLVHFPTAGTHYLWVRGWGDELNGEGKDDSLHAGLNGSLQSSADKIDGFPASWNWTNSTRDDQVARLNVPSVGLHTLNIWMREDGLAVDKFVITPDASYVPQGQGPSEVTDQNSALVSADQPWSLVQTSDGSYIDARHEAGAVALNGQLYVMGGRNNKPVESYNPILKKWTNHGTPPVFFHHFQPVALNGSIYVLGAMRDGGYPQEENLEHVYRYDPLFNTWTQIASVPQSRRRGSAGAAAFNGKIYLVGGNTLGHKGPAVNWFDEFDPATGQWMILPDAPHARDHATVAIVNDKLVVAAGRRSAHPNVFGDTEVATDVYDFVTGSWVSGFPDIPTARAGTMTVGYGNEVIVIGGETLGESSGYDTVESLDVENAEWRTLQPLLVGRHSGGAAIVNGEIHVVSGNSTRGGGAEITTHETLTLPIP